MSTRLAPEQIERTLAFHGHLCPGLTRGMRISEIALREIGPHAEDEEVVAVVETDNCAVDAIQVLTGCTFGKGNLIHLDHGQNVFTFSRRSDGKTVRISARPRPERQMDPAEEAMVQRVRTGQGGPEDEAAYAGWWKRRSLAVLDMDEADLFEVEELTGYAIPDRAQIHASYPCDRCGRLTMATRLVTIAGHRLCLTCLQEENA